MVIMVLEQQGTRHTVLTDPALVYRPYPLGFWKKNAFIFFKGICMQLAGQGEEQCMNGMNGMQ
jgi:hypothetical protein